MWLFPDGIPQTVIHIFNCHAPNYYMKKSCSAVAESQVQCLAFYCMKPRSEGKLVSPGQTVHWVHSYFIHHAHCLLLLRTIPYKTSIRISVQKEMVVWKDY